MKTLCFWAAMFLITGLGMFAVALLAAWTGSTPQ